MEKKKVKRTKPIKIHFEGLIVGRMCGIHPRFGCDTEMKINDEMDDVSDWAKDAAKKMTEVK